MAATARIEIPFVANVILPTGYTTTKPLTVYTTSSLAITLVQSEAGQRFQTEMAEVLSPEGSPAPPQRVLAALEVLSRTLVVPNVRMDFVTDLFSLESFVTSPTGKIEMTYDQIEASAWYRLYRQTESAFSTLVNALYLVIRDPTVLRLSTEIQFKYTTPLSIRFISLQTNLKEISLDGVIQPRPQFQIAPGDANARATESLPHIELPVGGVERWIAFLADANPVSPKWDLLLHYLLLSEEHFTFGDHRLAIIDLDIAIDICVRRWLRGHTSFDQDRFDLLTGKASTGDLLSAARFLAEGPDIECLDAFGRLHDLRNTVLHRHQRNIGADHIEIFLAAKRGLRALESTA